MSTKKMTTKECRAFIKEKIAECKTGCKHAEIPRYCIMSDDSGHEYFVPVDHTDDFNSWVEATEEDALDYIGPDFEANRIDGRFTFTDPRCD
jgi:hypothetical protein